MPRKYTIKTYQPEGYYYVFNQGIEDRNIFLAEDDYEMFLQFLSESIIPRDEKKLFQIIKDKSIYYKIRREAAQKLRRKNFSSEIRLFGFSLLPKSFYLILQHRYKHSLPSFMRALMTRYSMYYNNKYNRKGTLFEGAYKAIQITTETKLLNFINKIHLFTLHENSKLAYHIDIKKYSSYQYYCGNKNNKLLNTTLILSIFNKYYPNISYKEYINRLHS